MDNKNKKEQESGSLKHKILSIIGTVLCIILIPILAINVTLIAKSYINTEEVPSIGGVLPLIVLTDSMYPEIHSGDLIICHIEDAEDIQGGDVISYFDPAGNGTSIVTHRVTEVTTEDGGLAFRTKGDANNVEDSMLVPADKLVGVYQKRIPSMGNVAMFMQTTQGLIICVVCPILLLVGYDMIRRRKYEKSNKEDTDALLRELAELRAQKEAAEKQD